MEFLVKIIPWAKNIDIKLEWEDLLTSRKIYRIKLTAKPINWEANKQLMTVLSDFFNVKKRFIEIEKWRNTRLKLVKINWKL